ASCFECFLNTLEKTSRNCKSICPSSPTIRLIRSVACKNVSFTCPEKLLTEMFSTLSAIFGSIVDILIIRSCSYLSSEGDCTSLVLCFMFASFCTVAVTSCCAICSSVMLSFGSCFLSVCTGLSTFSAVCVFSLCIIVSSESGVPHDQQKS